MKIFIYFLEWLFPPNIDIWNDTSRETKRGNGKRGNWGGAGLFFFFWRCSMQTHQSGCPIILKMDLGSNQQPLHIMHEDRFLNQHPQHRLLNTILHIHSKNIQSNLFHICVLLKLASILYCITKYYKKGDVGCLATNNVIGQEKKSISESDCRNTWISNVLALN